jgi:hypothetical protein
MSDKNIEVSEKGVKLSYGRFLADSAGGYVFILVALWMILGFPADVKHVGGALALFKGGGGILLGIVILLLGSPLGLALNSASWFFLGWIQIWFFTRWANQRRLTWLNQWFTYSTRQNYGFTYLQESFAFLPPPRTSPERVGSPPADPTGVPRPRFLYSELRVLKRVMLLHFPDIIERVEYLGGIKIFIRNLSLLAIGVFVAWICKCDLGAAVISLGVAIFLTWLACLLEVYQSLELLFNAYAICLTSELKTGPGTDECSTCLDSRLEIRELLAILVTAVRRQGEQPPQAITR